MKTLLEKNSTNPIIIEELITVLDLCLKQNYLLFNDFFYEQQEGLAMGNPLSPLLAELFMNDLENKIANSKFFDSCLYWHRYVDDILIRFKGTDRQLTNFFDFLNSLHPKIKFTLEIEVNNSINFLDLTITKVNNKHQFSIFHKETHTDTIIPSSSFHPMSHKLAFFHSSLHRLITIPLSQEDYNKELDRIYQIAINNGYHTSLVNKLLKQKTYKKTLNLIYPNVQTKNKTNYNSLTYIGNISTKIGNHIKRFTNCNISFKTINSLGKYIKNNKDTTKLESKSGVYKLSCGNCEKAYIGQTGRSFKDRIKEHKKCFDNNSTTSSYAEHLILNNHNFDENYKVLHIENKGKKLNLLETLEINRLNKIGSTLNDQTELSNSPLLNL